MKFSAMNTQITKKSIPFLTDVLIMLIPFCLLACYFYGIKAVKILAVGTITALFIDFAGSLLLKKEHSLSDLSALTTGIIISLLMSDNTPLWLVALCSTVSIAVGKLPFGDFKKSPFVPAAVGIAFLIVCYPDYIFNYSPTLRDTGIFTSSLASILTKGNTINMTVPGIISALVGNCPGPVGATCAIALLAALVYFLIRHPNSFIIAAGFISVCCLFAVLFPRVLSGRQASILMEISSGMLLFTAIFLMTWPNKNFKSGLSALLYGLLGGSLCMLIRYFGVFEEGAVFAVLFCDAVSFIFEKKEINTTAEGGIINE